jgi:hypothetical protein
MDSLPVILQTSSLAGIAHEDSNDTSGTTEETFVHQTDVEMTEAQPTTTSDVTKNVVDTGMSVFVADLLAATTVVKPTTKPVLKIRPRPVRTYGTEDAAVQVNSNNLAFNRRSHLQVQVDAAQMKINKSIQKANIAQKQTARLKALRDEMEKKISALTVPRRVKDKQGVIDQAKHYLSGNALELFKMQVRMGGKSHYSRRWTREDIKFASELFTENQDAYTYLASVMVLPSMRSLFTHDIDFMDEELMLPSAEAEESKKGGKETSTPEVDEAFLSEVQKLIEIDIDKELQNMEKEQENEFVVNSEIQAMDDDDLEPESATGTSRLSDVVLNSKNTYVIDLTQLAAHQKNSANKEPQKVIVYMTVPKPKKTAK